MCVLGAGAKPVQHHAALSKWRSINACTYGNVVRAGRRLSCLPSLPGAPFQPVHQRSAHAGTGGSPCSHKSLLLCPVSQQTVRTCSHMQGVQSWAQPGTTYSCSLSAAPCCSYAALAAAIACSTPCKAQPQQQPSHSIWRGVGAPAAAAAVTQQLAWRRLGAGAATTVTQHRVWQGSNARRQLHTSGVTMPRKKHIHQLMLQLHEAARVQLPFGQQQPCASAAHQLKTTANTLPRTSIGQRGSSSPFATSSGRGAMSGSDCGAS